MEIEQLLLYDRFPLSVTKLSSHLLFKKTKFN